MMEASGSLYGVQHVEFAQRQKAFEEAKRVCPRAVAVDDSDYTANMHLGMLYKEGLEFDLAISFLRKALKANPDDVVVLTNLASALSRYAWIENLLCMAELTALMLCTKERCGGGSR
jgi:tetratricopeptide (TPR) repeat protein